jgi:hypothetical protein
MEVSSQLHTPATLTPGKEPRPPLIAIVQEAGWASKPVLSPPITDVKDAWICTSILP